MSPRISMGYREPVVDERTLEAGERERTFITEDLWFFQMPQADDSDEHGRLLYVERANTDHTPEHDDWDAGGYCNALCVEEDGSAYDCGYRKRDEFEWLVEQHLESGPIVDVWPAPGRWAERVEHDPKPLVASASFPHDAIAGQVGCPECRGTGWWGYGPTRKESGPCVECKGTGRVWVGL